jgi:hypothetical protein
MRSRAYRLLVVEVVRLEGRSHASAVPVRRICSLEFAPMQSRGISLLALALFAVSMLTAVIPAAAGTPRVPLAISVTPTTNNFGKIRAGAASIPQVFTVTNTGTSAFRVSLRTR